MSRDGRVVAGLDLTGRVLLWDVAARSGPVVISDGLGAALQRTLYFSPDQTRLYWLTVAPDRTRRLVVWDVRAAVAVPTGLGPITDPQIGRVMLTADRGAVAEYRPTGMTVRSIADGAVRATFPPEGVVGDRYVVTCVPGATVVRDAMTGQELRRLARLTADCTPEILKSELTGTGEFLVEAYPSVIDRDIERWRITSVHTGQVYELRAPPHTGDARRSGDRTGIEVALVGDRLVVYDLWQRSVLRLHADPADAGSGAFLTADRRYEVAVGADAITAVDAVTRGPAGTLPWTALADSGDRRPVMNADSVGMITSAPDHVSYAEYAVPGFTRIGTWTVPGGPVLPDGARPFVDSLADRVVALNNGVLAAWDRRTGRPVGTPIDLVTDAERLRHFRADLEVRLRPGPAWEVAVPGPHGVEIWDMAAGRQVAVLESESIGMMFDAAGERLAVIENGWSVQVWNVDERRRIGVPVVTPSALVPLGFTPDGLLAGGVVPDPASSGRILLIEPETGRQRGGFTLARGVDTDRELTADRRLVVAGADGGRPVAFPLEARQWADRLCGLLDRPFTDAARALLPASIDLDRPCG